MASHQRLDHRSSTTAIAICASGNAYFSFTQLLYPPVRI
jgi:hypothetical protein